MTTHTYTIIFEGGDLMSSYFAYDHDYAVAYQEMAKSVLGKEVTLQTLELPYDIHFHSAHQKRN